MNSPMWICSDFFSLLGSGKKSWSNFWKAFLKNSCSFLRSKSWNSKFKSTEKFLAISSEIRSKIKLTIFESWSILRINLLLFCPICRYFRKFSLLQFFGRISVKSGFESIEKLSPNPLKYKPEIEQLWIKFESILSQFWVHFNWISSQFRDLDLQMQNWLKCRPKIDRNLTK